MHQRPITKFAKQIDSALLVIGYVLGLNLFGVLKLAGIDPGYFMHKNNEFHWALPTIIGFLVGSSLAISEYRWLDHAGRVLPRWQSVVIRICITLFIIIFWLIAVSVIRMLLLNNNSDPDQLLSNAFQFIISPIGLTILIFLSLLSVYLSFIRQLGNHFGHGILFNFIIGKYATPKEEDRTFLFIDLRGSTGIAEQLGHVKYSRFINRCFYDISLMVARSSGEMYQYAGDEVILTWKNENAKIPRQAFDFFFRFCRQLENEKVQYLEKFGIFPCFKASMHCGTVAVSQVGGYQRELAYHGDVLNTTSRIMELCSRFQKDFLVSEKVAEQIHDVPGLAVYFQDQLVLRGKQTTIQVFEVRSTANPQQLEVSVK